MNKKREEDLIVRLLVGLEQHFPSKSVEYKMTVLARALVRAEERDGWKTWGLWFLGAVAITEALLLFGLI